EQRRQAGAGFLGGNREVPGRRRRRGVLPFGEALPDAQPRRPAQRRRVRRRQGGEHRRPPAPAGAGGGLGQSAGVRVAVAAQFLQQRPRRRHQRDTSLGGIARDDQAPRGVGTQNRAGRTKANNSSRSSAGNAARPRRRAVARAWQTNAVSPPSRRSRASSGDSASISPSGDSHTTSRKPATSAGACGTITGELSARSRVG